ncbi:MAG: hypothetical protein HZC45_04605 [Deltaproteobacteria bacterium]|nr:hypothetical protein [Deltaproteobacteria bacterium]
MAEVSRFLLDWIIPMGFRELMRWREFKQGIKTASKDSDILSRNKKFHNLYAGRRCFIIGTGPSISRQDLTLISNEITIVMNHFHEHPILEKWQPTFYCAGDPLSNYTPEETKYISKVASKIHPQAYFLHLSLKDMIVKNKMFPIENTYYLKFLGSPHEWARLKYNWNLNGAVMDILTTMHMAIIVALYLGCSPIYLIGADHDWLSSNTHMKHFYTNMDGNDFKGSYKYALEYTLELWQIHEALRDAALARGVTIYNATDGGFLDVYPRVDYKTLF